MTKSFVLAVLALIALLFGAAFAATGVPITAIGFFAAIAAVIVLGHALPNEPK